MSARDELAALIDENSCLDWAESAAVADAILAAGWREPLCSSGHEVGRAPDGGLWCYRCGTRLDHLDR